MLVDMVLFFVLMLKSDSTIAPSGWPYISPVIKDNELKVVVAAESIVTKETHAFYIWII
jgi:hypothetical protein